MTSFLNALHCKNYNAPPPIWIMRQAGRYLPSYQKMRARYPLRELFLNPELAAQVTQLPLLEFPFNAGIIFSDITLPALALGCSVDFKEGPLINPLFTPATPLRPFNLEALDFIRRAIQISKASISVPLIGFCAEPWTLATYLIDTHEDKTLPRIKRWLHSDPDSFHRLLEQLTQLSIAYLQMQVDAGADAIQIFDSHSHILADEDWRAFSLPYLQRVINSVKVPTIVFLRNSLLRASALSNCAISADWLSPLAQLRKIVGPQVPLQGNLDPDCLFAPLPLLRTKVQALLDSMEGDAGFILNLGHGIKPGTPVDAVHCLLGLVRE
jgi:uroporphyrinogen decarboxylase